MNFHSVSLSTGRRVWCSTCRGYGNARLKDGRINRSPASLKTAQDLSVDLNDCVNDAQVNSLRYCSDQDEINDTVLKFFIRVDMPLVTSSCSSVREMTCTGCGDTPSASLFCYTGLKLGEKVNSFNSEAGSLSFERAATREL